MAPGQWQAVVSSYRDRQCTLAALALSSPANHSPGLREPSECPLEPLPQLTEASVCPCSCENFP